jgi:hypothetical protein
MDSKVSDTINSLTDVTRSFIDTMQESSIIRMTDSDDSYGLQLFCYDSCEKYDTEAVKQCRGIVFSGETLVMKAFPYTEEIKREDVESYSDKLNLSECKFYRSYEGMLIRMFYYNDKWFITTHRKLDAFRSKWSSKVSFGDIFVKCIEKEYTHNTEFAEILDSFSSTTETNLLSRFENTLDKRKQYMFLLLNNEENRIVCLNDPEGPGMFHVGTFDSTSGTSLNENIFISRPEELANDYYSSLQDVYEHAQTLDYTKYQGIIIFAPNNKQYKVLNEEYNYFFTVRGNEPSIKFRYLQVRGNEQYTTALKQMYPNMIQAFNTYETYIRHIAKDIFEAYVDRFMKKKFATVSQDEYVIVKACHGWHLLDRKKNIVTLKRVFDEINNSSPSLINKMIRTRMQKDKKLKM